MLRTPALGRQGEPHSAQPRFVCRCPELYGGGQAGAVPLVRSIADDELLPAARGVSRSERGRRVSGAEALCKACTRPEAAQFFEQLALARILRTPAAGPVYRGDVVFDDVDFGYVPEKIVLHDVDLFATPGQKIAFVGTTEIGRASGRERV